jgi:hypothetical protein
MKRDAWKLPVRVQRAYAGAWTSLEEASPRERRLSVLLFEEQMRDFRNYWGDEPNLDTQGIFWNRARHDAHSTMREHERHRRPEHRSTR